MNFTSPIFIFVFLPITVIGYYLIRTELRNLFLLAASLFFYAWGEPEMIALLLVSITANYLFGLGLELFRESSVGKILVTLMLLWNFGILYYFKYHIFALRNINSVFGVSLVIPEIALPLGISFFTFRTVSYCLDIYWGAARVQENPIHMALYISFFPQVLMGPITRYSEFENQLKNRVFSIDSVTDGVKRLIIGMAKKAVLADQLAVMVDPIFNMLDGERAVLTAWLGILGYMLQLYLDFSGYSDMAIGMGQMFGFHTPENFQYPYLSKSVVEYWTRWHATLGEWLRVYLYTPVFRAVNGKRIRGKQVSLQYADYIALAAVWLFAGVWHGAAWHYILYGCYYCFFILLERVRSNYQKKRRKKLKLKKAPETRTRSAAAHIYVLMVVLFGMLIFRVPGAGAFLPYVKSMFGLAGNPFSDIQATFFWKSYVIVIIISALLCMPVVPCFREWVEKRTGSVYKLILPILYIALFLLAISFTVTSDYNPFLYFDF